jgi:hypothetical protein
LPCGRSSWLLRLRIFAEAFTNQSHCIAGQVLRTPKSLPHSLALSQPKLLRSLRAILYSVAMCLVIFHASMENHSRTVSLGSALDLSLSFCNYSRRLIYHRSDRSNIKVVSTKSTRFRRCSCLATSFTWRSRLPLHGANLAVLITFLAGLSISQAVVRSP